MKLFEIFPATTSEVPIILSVPHAGIEIPEELKSGYDARMIALLDDTDWFVDRLYAFAPSLGITVIKANLSRWVIDLNRDPESVPLYADDRLITSICPTTDFFGNALYVSPNAEPDAEEIKRRLDECYWPYYRQIEELLNERKTKFGKVLLWDAHSIRHLVSTIRKDPFPDMILGNNDEKTAHSALIGSTLESLKSSKYGVNHNSPFKGGHITRYFGKPENDVHGLQLEMNKNLYMDDNELTWNNNRAAEASSLLKRTFEGLIETINRL